MSTQVHLHDTDKLQLPGDVGNWQTVRELRALGYNEPELESIADFGAVERHGEWHTIGELRAAQKKDLTAAFPSPDIYAADLAKLKSASSAPELSFEATYKANRLAALNAEHRRLDDHITATPRMAEGRKTYPAPDGYQLALKKENR